MTEALAALERLAGPRDLIHPLAAMAEPLLMQYDGAADQAEQHYRAVPDRPRPVAAGDRASSTCLPRSLSLGRLDEAEAHCRTALDELRALGEQWGVAAALAHLAEFTELRADHAASIAALTEAAAIGRELGVWGDLTYVEARLALVYARAGDNGRARAELRTG